MKRLILFCMIPMFLHCEELEVSTPAFSFQAEEVSYDGVTNLFRGHKAVLTFRDNSRLSCRRAEFDQTLMRGVFSGGIEGSCAVYEGNIKDRKGNSVPIKIQGRQIHVEADNNKYDILTEDDVFIEYNKQYSAIADYATYHCYKNIEGKGTLHLMSDSEQRPCQISNSRRDCIQGDQIWIDMARRQMLFDKAKGMIHLPDETESRVNLAARTLTWEEEEGMITLCDEVVIDCEGFGIICSDMAIFEYNAGQGEFEPKVITFQGNVRMCNQFADVEGGSPLDQYALADKMTFTPKTRKMILNAKNGKRVLFYDKANHMQVSAPILTITSGTKVGKESIRGTGDVRFTFAEQELELLRKQFPKKM